MSEWAKSGVMNELTLEPSGKEVEAVAPPVSTAEPSVGVLVGTFVWRFAVGIGSSSSRLGPEICMGSPWKGANASVCGTLSICTMPLQLPDIPVVLKPGADHVDLPPMKSLGKEVGMVQLL